VIFLVGFFGNKYEKFTIKGVTVMRKFVLFLTLGLGVLFFSFNTQALLLEFKDDKALDTWTPVGGDWKIKDKLLEGKTTAYQDLMLNNADSNNWTDYTFETKGKLSGGRVWGVCFRYTDTSNNYRLNLYEDLDATNNLYIYKRVAGTFSEVFKVAAGKIDLDKWYTLKLTITKNTIQAYVDNVLQIEVEDKNAPLDTGTVALQGEAATTFQVEYFKIDGKGIPATAVESKEKLATLWGMVKQ
jgi:hypothetical protein